MYNENMMNLGLSEDAVNPSEQIEELTLEDYEYVRQEYFSNIKEPSVNFTKCSFYVNAACLSHLPENDYVQILINRKKKMMVLRPSVEEDRDSFLWCNSSGGKRKPRKLSCKLFFAKIVDLMGWNPNHRYKVLGKIAHANGESVLVFDLNTYATYKSESSETNRQKVRSVPIFPEDWRNQFGLPYSEHQNSAQISLFDGYAIFSLKDKDDNVKETQE